MTKIRIHVHADETLMEEFKAIAPEGSKLPGERYNHVLTRAMGPKESVEPHIAEIDPREGDILISAPTD